MSGLQIAERYYNFFGKKMIAEKFPEYQERIAVGLVGEGSDCFGFDDELSQDHDWGPAFCLWLNENDFNEIGVPLQNEYENLPKDFAGLTPRRETNKGLGRVGVLKINSFYRRFTGLSEPPSTWLEWIRIPEKNLAAATNGKIFSDKFGEFSFYRKKLLEFYPEDVRLKKIAVRCVVIGREGQYNVTRCVSRKDFVAAHYALAMFIESAISLIYLLNYSYMPFYKWMHRGLYNLPILGQKVYELIKQLVELNSAENLNNNYNKKLELMNIICGYIVSELNKQQLSESKSNFLLDHAAIIQSRINDDQIRNYNSQRNI